MATAPVWLVWLMFFPVLDCFSATMFLTSPSTCFLGEITETETLPPPTVRAQTHARQILVLRAG